MPGSDRRFRLTIGKMAVLLASLLAAPVRADEPSSDQPTGPADYDSKISDSDREHWAFQPVRRPAVPAVNDGRWIRNPIDAFLLAKLEEKGWSPAAPASTPALVRRMYFDVNGLPPTPDELAAVVNDRSADAIEKLVDELLARPAYGERWGRHWLDLVRYAETNGYERDGAKPHVWRYRDYVINSFNADKSFDRFLLEQLAGDELPDASPETVIALGYYRLGPWDDEPADPAEDRSDQLDDMVATTSHVFLGLTLACARCHNHKFEPLTTLDYYRLTAIFNPLQRFQAGRADLDAPVGNAAQLAALAERDKQIGELLAKIVSVRDAARQTLLALSDSGFDPAVVAAFQAKPEERTPEQTTLVTQNTKALDEKVSGTLPEDARRHIAECERAIAELKRQTPDLPRAYYVYEPTPVPPTTHVLLRGKATRPGIVATPGVPVVLASRQPEFPPPSNTSTQRRLTLARWLASPDNPLTARVIVNRVWQFHFGEGLVRTPSDFGVMGHPPTHPELLDYLAAELIRHGWSLKWLHRQILTSSAYRMSKKWRDDYGASDPENRLWWRFPYRRLEVEAIRDAMLSASGRLNRDMFGPAMYPYIPKEALAANSDPDKVWPDFDEVAASRRTVYAFIKRSLVVPMIEVLDLCDTTRSSAKRAVTSVAPQALTLFNGHFVNEQAAQFAARLEREAPDDRSSQIDRAYQLAFSRVPTAAERGTALDFVQQETARLMEESTSASQPLGEAAARHQALVQLCRVIFNMNEFVYPD